MGEMGPVVTGELTIDRARSEDGGDGPCSDGGG